MSSVTVEAMQIMQKNSSAAFSSLKLINHLTEICLIRLIITIIIVEIIINYIYVGKKLETESFVWYMYILKLSETLQETWIDITF